MTEKMEETSDLTEETLSEEEVTTPEVEGEAEEISEPNPLEEAENRYLRLLADFENYKRRTQREKEAQAAYAAERLIETLLPALDALDMALASAPEEEGAKNFVEGVGLTARKLMEALEAAGLKRIEAKGKVYDPALHEAIMTVEDPELEDDIIYDELRAGYMLGEKLLRPTTCRVVKNNG